MRVIIMRGIPGSGKSTWVEDNFDPRNTAICSADHYFLDEDGEYHFIPEKAEEAHLACQALFHQYLSKREWYPHVHNVVVDNTNIKFWEMAYYISLSRVFGIDPEIMHIIAHPDACAERNVHGVPREKVWRMYYTLETVPRTLPYPDVARWSYFPQERTFGSEKK